jgi:hypothetical protein
VFQWLEKNRGNSWLQYLCGFVVLCEGKGEVGQTLHDENIYTEMDKSHPIIYLTNFLQCLTFHKEVEDA